MDHLKFQRFIQASSRNISSISKKTKREHSPEDVIAELWITAAELQRRKGLVIDFNDPEHQGLVLSHTHQRLVHYCDKKVRTAKSLDHGYSSDAPSPYEKIAGQEGDDPFVQLVLERQEKYQQAILQSQGISVGAVWLAMLERFGGRMFHVAHFLRLSLSHSYRCYRKVQWVSVTQLPLALQVGEKAAVRRVRPWRSCKIYRTPEQLGFNFEEGLALD